MDKLHTNKYKTILADPPWDINQKGKRGAARHYPLMTLDQIKAMPVQDLCEENAHLYLWIPNGLLQEGLDVIKAWGFTYRSPIYWIKPRLCGLGQYIRNASETCLFATRGRAPVKFHGQPSWLFAPVQEHFINERESAYGFRPAPVTSGKWKITLSMNCIITGKVTVRVIVEGSDEIL